MSVYLDRLTQDVQTAREHVESDQFARSKMTACVAGLGSRAEALFVQ